MLFEKLFDLKRWKRGGSTRDVEKILEATVEVEGDPDTLYFWVKMKGRDDPDLLRAEVANEKIPHLVIEFYETRLNWMDQDNAEGMLTINKIFLILILF